MWNVTDWQKVVLNPGLFWGQMITVYGCGVAQVSVQSPPHCFVPPYPHSWCNGLGGPFPKWSLRGNFFSKIMLVPLQKSCSRHPYVIFQTLPRPARTTDLSPVDARVGSPKTADAIVSLCT
ncbi:hypothetical protein TNCV_2086191 [Trichonephila clavipes]|nr:hypothetical protein TNCV_2086191 [Trichonephila clavipes]